MAKPILMPKAGITVESCILTTWNVKVGDTVKVGDVICSYETDKSAFDLTSEVEGEVLALFCEEGDEVPVLTNIAAVGAKGEDYSALAPNGQAAAAPAVEEVKAAPAPVAAAPAPAAAVTTNAKPVTMPKAGITVESCILTKWNVKVGDKITFPKATVVDNNDALYFEWVTVQYDSYVKVMAEDYTWEFKVAGTYIIEYGASDEDGNYTVYKYAITCE